MASDKQLRANRSNAKQSTGPRSQHGKARSRLNSRKHGLTAKALVICDEDPDQFDKLRTELMEEYDPQSAVECELVERLSSLLWRLRRIPAFEAAIIDARRAEVDDPLKWLELGREERLTKETIKVRILGHALVQDAAYHDTLGKLARHETTLMHAFAKTLQMLLLLCNRRSNRGDGLIIEPISLPPKA